MTEFKKLALVLLLFVALSRASDSEVISVTAVFTRSFWKLLNNTLYRDYARTVTQRRNFTSLFFASKWRHFAFYE